MTSFRFDHPDLLWLLLLGIPIVWLGMRSLAQLERARRWTAIALRLAVLLVIVLMLAGLQTVRTHSELTVIAVVDQSESVRRFGSPPRLPDADAADPGRSIDTWLPQWLSQAAGERRQEDRFGMVTYDARPTVRSMPTQAISLDPGTIDQPAEGTDTAAAIRSAMAIFPADTGARLVLASDGNEAGSGGEAAVLAAAREAAAAGIPVDVLPIDYRVGQEVMVEALYAPTQAREGQSVALRVVLRATAPSPGRLQLIHDDVPLDLNGDQPGTGMPVSPDQWTVEGLDSDTATAADADPRGRYLLVKQIDLPLAYSGANKFEAVFEPDAPRGAAEAADVISINNRAQAFTLVQGKGRILFVDNLGGDSGMILPNTLASRGIELDVVPGTGMPTSLTQLQRYDAVVFQNVPADLVTGPQQRMLAAYVNNMGGGFVMIGGDDSFAAGGWTNSPIDRILPVECEIPSQTVLPSGALVIVLDRSGSMSAPVGGSSHTQQELANEAAVLAIQTLYPQDLVGVVAFDGSAQWVAPLQMNQNPGKVIHDVRSIHPQGGTNIYSGLDLAYRELANLNMQDAAVRHVIVLTDGHSTPPPGGSYVNLVRDMTQAGITISTVGVGDGHDAATLNQLAQMSGGQYHPVRNPNNLPQVFIKEAKTIRKNLIREQPFTPQLVRTGSPIMANVPAVPQLQGLVLTGEKSDPRVFTPIVGPEGEPVFAHWQVGLGRSAAFTSDATNRWAVQWLQWGGYADFWARTMRLIARPSASREADMITSIEGDRIRIRLDAMADDAPDRSRPGSTFANFLDIRGSVLKPDGSAQPIELEQVGPGIYETHAPAQQTGNYIVSLFMQDDTGQRRSVFGGTSRPPGEELRRFQSNRPLLQQVAQITGGRVLDPAAASAVNLFDRSIPYESRSIRPLWRTLLLWLVVLLLLDVACRRIAWDPVAIYAWARQRARAFAGTLQPRQSESQATLGALKNRRAQAQAELAAAPDQTPPTPTRKFEADADFQAHDDFTHAVGGANENTDARTPIVTAAKSDKAGEQVGTTSRLLAAKRRAQQKLTDDD